MLSVFMVRVIAPCGNKTKINFEAKKWQFIIPNLKNTIISFSNGTVSRGFACTSSRVKHHFIDIVAESKHAL